MTERMDHAAQAVHVLGNFPHEHIADSETALAWAQVHATLALVEQQRISNDLAREVKESNDRLLEQMNDVVKIAREGWDYNRIVAALEQERANR